ncbi:MAG: DUF4398 domain-containing protein [Deltaproteobacteria bacterium]|nr:DUF4398 domain-containing protein [Deltaproteobacteria bacterium]
MKVAIEIFGLSGALLLIASGCAGATVPVARMSSAQAAVRAAVEVGADRNARASLHLRLAREQLGLARSLARDGEEERATSMLRRAQMDAELALAITRQAEADERAANAASRARTVRAGAI